MQEVLNFIEIENDFLPSKNVKISFENFKFKEKTYVQPNIIFARNGMGKTTLAREIRRQYSDAFNVFVWGEMFKPSFTKLGTEEVATLVVEDSDKTYFSKIEKIREIDNLIEEQERDLRKDIDQLLIGGARKSSDTFLSSLNFIIPKIGYYTKKVDFLY